MVLELPMGCVFWVLLFLVWLVAVPLITILAWAILFYLISSLFPTQWRTNFPSASKPVDRVPEEVRPHVRGYVDRALKAYANQPDGVFRYVNRFWLAGGVFGWVDDRCDDVTYVTFRGTSEFGNWFLTNAQAHMVEAGIVFGDDSVKGGVHQGFVKAYRDLWYVAAAEKMSASPEKDGAARDNAKEDPAKKDPAKKDPLPPCNPYGWEKWLLAPLWCAIFYFPVYCAALYLAPEKGLHFSGQPLASPEVWFGSLILVTLAVLVVAQRDFAFGRFERGFERKNKLFLGPALSNVLQTREDKSKKVVFIGHSLGGALATLAFVDYLTKSSTSTTNADIQLVTFGAPSVGNDEFGDWLRKLSNKHKFYIVAGTGDPVPHLPPRKGSFFKVALASRTPIGAVLAAVYAVGWLPYAWCYSASLGPRWNSLVCWINSPEEGLTSGNHDLTYTELEEKT